MSKITTCITLCLLMLSHQIKAQNTEADIEALVTEGTAVINDFTASLEGELASAIQSGGAVKAMDVCHSGAPKMAAWLAEKHQAKLIRKSFESHSSENTPAWQATILKDFETRLAAGEAIEQLVFTEVAEESGKQEFRMMRAIPTGEVCLTCHGSKVSPNVFATLNMLYPVVGYSARDVSAAFVYVKSLDQ